MPVLLPRSWMQAAAFVAIGYGVRAAGIFKDKEIQVGTVRASFCARQAGDSRLHSWHVCRLLLASGLLS